MPRRGRYSSVTAKQTPRNGLVSRRERRRSLVTRKCLSWNRFGCRSRRLYVKVSRDSRGKVIYVAIASPLRLVPGKLVTIYACWGGPFPVALHW